jgi:hypothetical protein
MGDYLKDSFEPFLTISTAELDNLNNDLVQIVNTANLKQNSGESVSLSYVLRYDDMGIVRTDFKEIKRCFEVAKKVERVAFYVTTPKNYLNKGKFVEILLDRNDRNQCILKVTDDDEAWVDTTFKRLSSRLEQYRNRNWVVHSSVIELLIQLLGVLTGFSACLLTASIVAPLLKVPYSFIILLLGLFLVFSNLWTYILFVIGQIRIREWPFISFRKKPLGIIGQSIIGVITGLAITGLLRVTWWFLSRAGSLVIK